MHFLHSRCPKDTEWSALLIYKITKGSIDEFTNPENTQAELELTAKGMFPMDYGDATFTSFEGNEDWFKCFEAFPQIDPANPTEGWYIGKVHSHHRMSVFHSPTDTEDLHTTAPKLPMFLSLIVNYNGDLDCKLAIEVESEEVVTTKLSWKLKNWKIKREEVKQEVAPNKITYIINCDPYYLQDDWLVEQCAALTEKKKSRSYTYQGTAIKRDNTPVQSTFEKNCYRAVLSELGELFSLGAYEGTPYEALNKVDNTLGMAEKEKYIAAFKFYFAKRWYFPNFGRTAYLASDVIKAAKEFIGHHKERWIYGVLTQALNEIGNEWYTHWEVQRTPVV